MIAGVENSVKWVACLLSRGSRFEANFSGALAADALTVPSENIRIST
jgi:hypothetical protein